MMLSPKNSEDDFARLEAALLSIEKKPSLSWEEPPLARAVTAMSVREALLSPSIALPVDECEGKILASPSVACPPAVPILVCGEVIDKSAIELFRFYGITDCRVILT
jgi:arginine/lysine/ornithine decarboxylase